MSRATKFAKTLTKLDRSAFNPSIGLRAAIFTIAPLVLAFFINQPYLFLSTLGALMLTNTEGQPSTLPGWVLLVACLTEAAGFGLGTLAATTGPFFSTLLLGIAVFVALSARISPRWAPVGTFTAVTFAVGVGLPGESAEAAGLRAVFSLLGCLWAWLGVELHRTIVRRRGTRPSPQAGRGPILQLMPRSEALRSALMIAIACGLGFSIGFALGLPRDYWVAITIIVTVRPSISLTTSFTAMMAAGTIAGAFIGAAIILATSNLYVLVPLLFAFAVLMFASRGVNLGIVQLFLTPFIIILLNVLYPGEWYLAFYRILDVGIGVVIALIMVELLEAFHKTSSWL